MLRSKIFYKTILDVLVAGFYFLLLMKNLPFLSCYKIKKVPPVVSHCTQLISCTFDSFPISNMRINFSSSGKARGLTNMQNAGEPHFADTSPSHNA